MQQETQTIKTISISGLDGSGKTTQVKLLKDYLEQQGEKVFYFHASQFSIANQIADLFTNKKTKKVDSQNQDSGDSVTKSNWFLIQLRKVFLIIDIFRFKLLLRKLQKQSYTHLITDRYFYDSIVNIQYLTQKLFKKDNNNIGSESDFTTQSETFDFKELHTKENNNSKNEQIDFPKNTHTCIVLKIIEKIIPRPSVAFYLAVPPSEIMSRKRAPEQGLSYLQIKNSILDHNFSKWNLKKVLGNSPKKQVFQTLKENLI